ncbi:MAG: arylamine N-acetyltransferase [Verrucomicrobiales bacterium]|nr:arylamine N-acetyltransferase [Verrucomicrobiales bacterium]
MSEIRGSYLEALNLSEGDGELEFIRQLQSRHLARFSFNSLAVVLSEDIPLDSESLHKKIVQEGRGGYCFEHNKLTYDVLFEMGFDVRILLARVVYKNGGEVPKTHRVTLLKLGENRYIVDTGFGQFGSRFPVSLTSGVEQGEGAERYRVVRDSNNEYALQIFQKDDFVTLYTFDLARHIESDCLLGHFYSHRHEQAVFVNNLVVCRKDANCIRSLRNGEFHRIQEGATEVVMIDGASILQKLLTEEFGLSVNSSEAEFLYGKFSCGE